MDKHALPPWLRQVWQELTKPPAVLQKPANKTRSSRQPTQRDVDDDESDPTLYDSPTDPPLTPKEPIGSIQTATRASRRYFVARKTPQHRTKTKPRPRKKARPAKQIQTLPLMQGIMQMGQPQQHAIQTTAPKTSAQPLRTLRTSESTKTKSEVLRARQYFEHIRTVEPIQNVWKVTTTNDRQYALKQTTLPIERIAFMADALDELHRRGFKRVSRIVRSAQSNKPYLIDSGHTFYASEWMPGLPVQLASMRQLNAAAKTLAQFHEHSRNYEYEPYQPANAFHIFDHLLNRKQDLIRLRKRIEQQQNKTKFDELCLQQFEKADKQANEALALCKLPEVETHLKQALQHPGLCHLDVTRSNLIVHPAGFVQLIDFDTMTFGPRTLDLAHLLRRAMQAYGAWSNEVALIPLIAYNRVQPLVQGEYLLLESLLTFPHRFWRVVNAYYNDLPNTDESFQFHLKHLQESLALEGQRETFLQTFARQVTRRIHS
ncbi:CotS family spore coat protein [Sulfoacidibacillus thermotolerans]|uniref:Aminoglycoside phosphotransferase domain-containing protein n=1 Tax=Sulfoacidibacillus thermotolerans TaxID=1765684 RepID=A0A2U3D9Y0_SULT2|nr:CotS family spore coat protein [Sulfoacidibacillus thermotolerans]PWI58094.1 hypothetical protein BM613_05365 [Sulfoacidibacillus thermotolerans]